MTYIIIGIITAIALIIIAWFQVKADQERVRNGLPKKHNEQIITVITFSNHKE